MTAPESTGVRRLETAAPDPPRRGLWGRLSIGHVLMLVAGLIAILLNFAVIRARDEVFQVAVAGQTVLAGTELNQQMFTFTEVKMQEDALRQLVQPEAIGSVEGQIAASTITQGELLQRSDWTDPAAPLELRSISIPVNREHAVGGRLAKGDRIDVIAVDEDKARYVLVDAEVLEIADPGTGGLTSTSQFWFTVAVTADQALELSPVIRDGKFEVVRSTGSAAPENLEFAPAPETSEPEEG